MLTVWGDGLVGRIYKYKAWLVMEPSAMDHANERCPTHGELGKCEQCEEPEIEEVPAWRLLRAELRKARDKPRFGPLSMEYFDGYEHAMDQAIERLEHYFEQ